MSQNAIVPELPNGMQRVLFFEKLPAEHQITILEYVNCVILQELRKVRFDMRIIIDDIIWHKHLKALRFLRSSPEQPYKGLLVLHDATDVFTKNGFYPLFCEIMLDYLSAKRRINDAECINCCGQMMFDFLKRFYGRVELEATEYYPKNLMICTLVRLLRCFSKPEIREANPNKLIINFIGNGVYMGIVAIGAVQQQSGKLNCGLLAILARLVLAHLSANVSQHVCSYNEAFMAIGTERQASNKAKIKFKLELSTNEQNIAVFKSYVENDNFKNEQLENFEWPKESSISLVVLCGAAVARYGSYKRQVFTYTEEHENNDQ